MMPHPGLSSPKSHPFFFHWFLISPPTGPPSVQTKTLCQIPVSLVSFLLLCSPFLLPSLLLLPPFIPPIAPSLADIPPKGCGGTVVSRPQVYSCRWFRLFSCFVFQRHERVDFIRDSPTRPAGFCLRARASVHVRLRGSTGLSAHFDRLMCPGTYFNI